MNQLSQCQCAETKITVSGKPVARAICHCTICQEFNQAPFADITAFYADDVQVPEGSNIEFKTYTKSPTAVPRGKCKQCGNPAIETMDIPGFPKMILIPSNNFDDQSFLPAPALHMFYHRRVADLDDATPKYSSFLSSQLGFVRHLIPALIKHKR